MGIIFCTAEEIKKIWAWRTAKTRSKKKSTNKTADVKVEVVLGKQQIDLGISRV